MDKKRFVSVLLFSIVITILMNSLDMLFHLFEGTTVHLDYVAIKIALIFASIFLTSLLVGLGKSEGIFASILGPVVFFLYYRYTFPTLNRQLFRIDDQLWYVIPHVIFFMLSYWLVFDFIKNKKYNKIIQNVGRGLILTLMSVAFDFIYRMSVVSVQTGRDAEAIARTLDHVYALKLFIPLLILFSLLFILMKRYRSFAAAILAGVVVFIIDKDIIHAILLIILTFISYLLLKKVRKS